MCAKRLLLLYKNRGGRAPPLSFFGGGFFRKILAQFFEKFFGGKFWEKFSGGFFAGDFGPETKPGFPEKKPLFLIYPRNFWGILSGP